MTDQIVIPAKPGHRIVIVSPSEAYYEHLETGARTPITIPAILRRALGAIDPDAPDPGTPPTRV